MQPAQLGLYNYTPVHSNQLHIFGKIYKKFCAIRLWIFAFMASACWLLGLAVYDTTLEQQGYARMLQPRHAQSTYPINTLKSV